MKIKIVFVIGIKIDIWIELNVDIEIKNAEEYQLLIEMKESDKDAFVRAIDDEYRIHWTVDNLPVGKYIRSCPAYL